MVHSSLMHVVAASESGQYATLHVHLVWCEFVFFFPVQSLLQFFISFQVKPMKYTFSGMTLQTSFPSSIVCVILHPSIFTAFPAHFG